MADTIKCLGEINIRDGLMTTILEVNRSVVQRLYQIRCCWPCW